LREYNYLILGFAQMEHGEALATLQTFEGFAKEYPKSPEAPHVRKARAEAYVILRKFDEATEELESIMKDFPRSEHAQEARYRLGDVQFAKSDLTQAISSYESAIKDLPKEEKIYPNAHFNMAEARFWQKDFKKSLNDYVQFVNLFPTHEHGGYALTRIGELLNILGADQRRVMGAYLESYFRFPEHPGAKVARIRMLSQQMRGMKETELKRALQEIKDAKKIDLPGVEQFTTLMAAEGLTNRGQNSEALNSLITYYQKNPRSANLGSFKQRILRNIANELKDSVDKNDFMKALSFYSKYSGTWLKNSGRIDVPYIVGGAYESAGAYDEAERIYRAALEERKSIVGTPTEKEKNVQEHLPSVAALNLRLAAVLCHERNYIEAYQHLKTIGDGGGLSPEENIERVRLSALIAEQRNDLPKAREALAELSKRWQGDVGLVAPVHLQLAQTYLKMNDPKQAEYYADRALSGEAGEAKVNDKVLTAAYQVKAEALMAQNKPMAAVETYQKQLERFEQKMPLASVRYKVGQILFDRGDFQGANDTWKRLEGTPNEFLWKIGREKLADSQWKGDYNKYINRIPAMTANKAKEKQ
jgi:tetratricopeptide (TPR) repeat protein